MTPDYGAEDQTPRGRRLAVEQDQAVNANTADATGVPLRAIGCRETGRHQLHTPQRLWCDCPTLEPVPDDDGGDCLVRQSGGIHRDRYQRVVR